MPCPFDRTDIFVASLEPESFMLIRSNGAYIVKKNSYSGKKWLLKVYAMYEVQHLKVSLLL